MVDDRNLNAARVYARAMLDLVDDDATSRSLLAEVQALAAYAEQDAEFHYFVSSPVVAGEARGKVLESSLRGTRSDLLVDSLQVMNRKGRLGLIPELAVALEMEYEARAGILNVRVQTATPLSEGNRSRLKEAVSKLTGKEPKLIESVDESILGGMVLYFDDREIDASVATDVQQLGEQLQARASRELHGDKSYWA